MFLKLLFYRETYRTLLIPLEGNKAKHTKNKSLIRSQKKQISVQMQRKHSGTCQCEQIHEWFGKYFVFAKSLSKSQRNKLKFLRNVSFVKHSSASTWKGCVVLTPGKLTPASRVLAK